MIAINLGEPINTTAIGTTNTVFTFVVNTEEHDRISCDWDLDGADDVMIDPYSHEHRLCQCKYPDEGEYTVTVKVRQIESEAGSIYSIPVLVTKDTNTVTTEIILGQDGKDYALTGTQEDIFNFIVRFPVDGSIYGNFYCCEFQIDEASWSKSTFNQIYPPYCSFQCQ